MKARVKATGEIVGVEYNRMLDSNGEPPYVQCDENGNLVAQYIADQLSWDIDNPDYWTRLEHQYAGMAMQGLLNNRILAGESVKANNNGIKDMSEVITRAAVVYATALVEKLKEEQRHGTKAV